MENNKNISLTAYVVSMIIIAVVVIIVMMSIFNSKENKQENVVTTQSQTQRLENTAVENQASGQENAIAQIENNTSESSNVNSKSQKTEKYADITREFEGIDVLYVTDVEKGKEDYTIKGILYTQYSLTPSEVQKIVSAGKMKIKGIDYKVKKDDDDRYTLYNEKAQYGYGIAKENDKYYIYAETQFGDVWKRTNQFLKITVPKDLDCGDSYAEDLKTTVEKEFKNFKKTIPEEMIENESNLYTFDFYRGNCSKVIHVTTGV